MNPTGKRKTLLPALFLIFVFAGNAFAQKNAGIIPYFKNGGKIYLLLADHKNNNRGWGSFGGKHEEKETQEQNAIREFHEETKNRFMDQGMEAKISSAPFIEQKKFVSYLVEVDFVPVNVFMNADTPGESYHERGPYAWVPLEEVLRAVNSDHLLNKKYLPKNHDYNKVYKAFAKALRIAAENGIFTPLLR